MDSSLNHFRASQGRRSQRKEKKNRKYNQSSSSKIKAEYKTQLENANFTEEARIKLRERLILEEKRRKARNIGILVFIAICVSILFVWLLRYLKI